MTAGPARERTAIHHVVIVGAGIAGLAAAWELAQRGAKPLVLERSARAGGVILTEQVDGFVIDAGPDALLIQKPAAIALCRELGLGGRLFPTLQPRTAFVLRKGRLIPLPEASVFGLPTRIGPFVRTRLFSLPGKLRMGCELFVPARRDGADESIGSFIRRRFGAEAVDYLAEPLLAGIHAGDVNRLSMQSTFPRLAQIERTHGSVLRGLASTPSVPSADGAFLSLPGGIGELAATLVQRLPADTIQYGAEVRSITGPGPYALHLADGQTLTSRSVIVAAPAWAAAAMLAGVDPLLARLCAEIEYASSAIAVFGLRRDQVRHPMQGSGYVVPRVERRRVMAATWVTSKWPHRAPEGHALLRAFLGGAADPDATRHSDEAIAAAAFSELSEVLGINGDPLVTRVYRWPNGSAQHTVGHVERMKAIDERLAAFSGLDVTGSGFRGSGIPDCVADGRMTAARLFARLQ
jgi:oxygen-dependent protoporphyrinogen oxidase